MRTITVNEHEYSMDDPVTTDGMLDAFDLYSEAVADNASRVSRKARKVAPLWAVLLDSDGKRYESPESVAAVVPFADFGALTEIANSIRLTGTSSTAPCSP
jgi:hypothetical protein